MAEEQKAGAEGAADAMLAQLDFAATCDAILYATGQSICSTPATSVMRFVCCGHVEVSVACDVHRARTEEIVQLGRLHQPAGCSRHLAVVKFEALAQVSS